MLASMRLALLTDAAWAAGRCAAVLPCELGTGLHLAEPHTSEAEQCRHHWGACGGRSVGPKDGDPASPRVANHVYHPPQQFRHKLGSGETVICVWTGDTLVLHEKTCQGLQDQAVQEVRGAHRVDQALGRLARAALTSQT